MKTFKRECQSSLSIMLVVMLVASMMMGVFTLSASAEDDNKLPKVVNVPALAFSGRYETDEKKVTNVNNINTYVFNMVFNEDETDLQIDDIQSITYQYDDADMNMSFSGNLNYRVLKDFDMVICSFNEEVVERYWCDSCQEWHDNYTYTAYCLKDIVSYKMSTNSVTDVIASLRRSTLNVTMTYSDGSTDTQKINLIEDNLHSYYGVNGSLTEVDDPEFTTEMKTYLDNGNRRNNNNEFESTYYSFSTTGSVSIITTTGTVGQTLCTLLVKLAHSKNIDNDSIMELDNAIFDLTEGSATTNRYYVDIDSEENVVLPMNTMSKIAELVQTRVGDNIVYNTESSVNFDRPVQALADGSADIGRVFNFDLTNGGYIIKNVKATEEDMHLMAQLLQEHTENPESLNREEKFAMVAELNGELISLADELYYSDGLYEKYWVLGTAKSFAAGKRNQLMLDLYDNGYVLQNIGRKRIPGTNYDDNNTNYIQGYHNDNSYSPYMDYNYGSIEYDGKAARNFQIAIDISDENVKDKASELVDKILNLNNGTFDTQDAYDTYNSKSYRYGYNEYSRYYNAYGYANSSNWYQRVNNISVNYLYEYSVVYQDSSYSYNNYSGSYYQNSNYNINGLLSNDSEVDYLKNRFLGSTNTYSYNSWRYGAYTETNKYTPNKLILNFDANGYELMNKYLALINECGLTIIGNESYMPDFENADRIPVKDYLHVTESTGLKESWVHTEYADYAKYGDYEYGVSENTDEIIKDTYDGNTISFPLEMLNNKEKGTPYNVINQVITMATDGSGGFDTTYSPVRLGAYDNNGEWAFKGNVYYLDGEFIRSYNTATEFKQDYYLQDLAINTYIPAQKGLLRHTEYKWGEVVLASRPDPVEDLAFDTSKLELTWNKPVDEGFGVETTDTPERKVTKKDNIVYVESYTITLVDDKGNITYTTVVQRDKNSDNVKISIPEDAINYTSEKNTFIVHCTNIIGDSDDRKVEFKFNPSVEIKMTPDKPEYKDTETVIYKETVTNTGDVKLTDVKVNQLLPGEYVEQDGVIPMGTTAQIPDLKPGESFTYYYKVPASIAVDNTIVNDADVTTAQRVTDEDTCTVHTYSAETKDVPTPVYKIKVTTTPDKTRYNDLENIYYTDVVTNTGDYPLTNIVVEEAFDKGEYINTENVTLNDDGTVTIAKLEPGESVTLTYKINVQDAPISSDNKVTNLVTAVSEEGAEDDDSSVVDVIHYSIDVTKLVDNRKHFKGDNVVFTNIVKNDGDTRLTNIVVTEDLDGKFVLANGAVIMNDYIVIAVLEPGQSYTYQYVVPANDKTVIDGKVTSTVTATASEDSIAESSEKVSDTDTNFALVNDPAIEVTKTVDGRTYKIGETVVWTDTITNKGDMPLTDVVVTESINGTFDVPYDTTDNSFIIPTLDVGESYTFTFSTVVTNENVSNKIHETTVRADAAEGVSDDATANVPVNSASIKVVKTVTKDEYTPNDTIIYTDVITNNGDVTLTEVVVKENHPGTFKDYNPKYKADGDTLIIDKIEIGQSIVFKYEVKVADVDYSENNTITSTVVATAKENVSDEDTVDVIVIIPDPEPVISDDDSDTESEVIPEPETESEVIPEPETESEVIPEPETESEVIPEPETESEVIPEPETESEVIPEPETESEVASDPDTSTDNTMLQGDNVKKEKDTDSDSTPKNNNNTNNNTNNSTPTVKALPVITGGSSESPVKTGDTRNIVGFAMVMLITMACMTVLYRKEED